MPRAIWKGHVSFGLVNIPVSLFSAENRSEDLSFRLVDGRNMARVRYQRVNEVSGEEVPWDQIVKAYEHDNGEWVVLGEEDFRRAAIEATQTVEIESFTDRDAIGYVYFDKPYYLVPGKKGDKGYVLLREALRRAGKVGVARVVIRTRQYLGALIPEGDALVLELLRYKHELREAGEFEFPAADLKAHGVTDREMSIAEQLISSMTEEWQPEKYRDEYRDALLKWIEEKVRSGETSTPAEAPAAPEDGGGAEVIDMMALLRRSIEQRKKDAGKASAKAAPKRKKGGGGRA